MLTVLDVSASEGAKQFGDVTLVLSLISLVDWGSSGLT